MTFVLNRTAAKISAAPRATRKFNKDLGRSVVNKPAGKMYDFIPATLVDVDEGDLKELLKIPSIEKAFENEDLVTGETAKKIATRAKKEIQELEETETEAET